MPNAKLRMLIAAAFAACALEAAAGEAPVAVSSKAPEAAPAAAGTPAATPATPAATAATAAKANCEDIKASIDAKIKAKGVKAFTLEIVGKEEVKDAKVVGSCEGGSKKITYKRG